MLPFFAVGSVMGCCPFSRSWFCDGMLPFFRSWFRDGMLPFFRSWFCDGMLPFFRSLFRDGMLLFFRSWFRDGMLPFFRSSFRNGMLPFFPQKGNPKLFGIIFLFCVFFDVEALLFDAFWGLGPSACAMASRLCEFLFFHVF